MKLSRRGIFGRITAAVSALAFGKAAAPAPAPEPHIHSHRHLYYTTRYDAAYGERNVPVPSRHRKYIVSRDGKFYLEGKPFLFPVPVERFTLPPLPESDIMPLPS